jgi:hypothetical protein
MRPATPFLAAALLALPLAARAEEAAGASPAPEATSPGAAAEAAAPAPPARQDAPAAQPPAAAQAPQAPAAEPDLKAAPPPAVTPVAVVAAPPPAQAPRKHGIFPLWGDAVRAKGFDLPNPYSVMFNYYYQSSELTINNLRLGFNGGPMRNFDDIIQIPSAKATGSALSVRPAIMVFPFLSFYGVFSTGATQTDVSVTSPVLPIAFDTVAKSGVSVFALGATFQMGWKGFFGVADFNGAVSDVERLADLVGANLLSFRLGYAHKLNDQGRKIAGWVGTAGQVIDVNTEGQVRLASVLPPVTGASCPAFPPSLNERCQALANAIGDPNATVEYKLDKKPKNVWNALAGAQYALDRNWAFRVEVSFLNGRTSFFAGAAYEFDII